MFACAERGTSLRAGQKHIPLQPTHHLNLGCLSKISTLLPPLIFIFVFIILYDHDFLLSVLTYSIYRSGVGQCSARPPVGCSLLS